MELEQLIETIKKANRDYYLLGESDLTDAEYDSYVEQLRALDPSNPILNKVGDDSATENKVRLPITMGSLNKLRPNEADLVKLYNKLDLVKMPKLDGLSMLIEYKDGKFERLYTRGNGFEGQDITGRAEYMNFPKELNIEINSGTTYVIGEALISRSNFKQITGYKHPRNAVGGILRPILTNDQYKQVDQEVKDNCKLVDIVVYGLVAKKEFELFTDIMEVLRKNNFLIADYSTINCLDLTPQYMSKEIKGYYDNYTYLTDGIVLRVNNMKIFNALGKEANDLNPKGARAIKANLEDQFALIGTIDHIDWEMSKRGNFVPVLNLKEPLNFEGCEVNRVNGINVKYVRENRWNTGSNVKLVRSGGVIPRVIASDSSKVIDLDIPEICPYCHTKLEENDAHIYCPNKDCIGRTRAGVIDFFTKLDLEDVSYQTIASLFDAGFNTYEKLISIRYSQLIEMEGYQARKAMAVEKALNNCLKNITLAKLLYISQCFMNEKNSLGETKLQWIIDAYGEENILASMNNEKDKDGNFRKLNPEVLLEIKGLGEAGRALFKENWREFKKLYFRLKDFIIFKKPEIISNILEGKSFAFTNFRDPEMEELITKNGGTVKGVTKKTTVLFAASSDSTKVKTAEKFGIPIVSAAEARKYLNKLLLEK